METLIKLPDDNIQDPWDGILKSGVTIDENVKNDRRDMNDGDSDTDDCIIKSKSKLRRSKILSDDEGDEIDSDVNDINDNMSDSDFIKDKFDVHATKEKIVPHRRIITDNTGSDSDDDDIFNHRSKQCLVNEIPDKNLNSKQDYYSPEPLKHQIMYRSDVFDTEISDDEEKIVEKEDTRRSNKKTAGKSQIKYASDTFDPEISEDEESFQKNESSQSDLETEVKKKAAKKSKKKGQKKQSIKERKQNMMDIHSTSQRMIRESEVSLPYHRPKQRTLKEFLNRKKYVPQPDKRKSLKMSMKDINYLKEIENRKQEVDKFYKSESEDEEADNRFEIRSSCNGSGDNEMQCTNTLSETTEEAECVEISKMVTTAPDDLKAEDSMVFNRVVSTDGSQLTDECWELPDLDNEPLIDNEHKVVDNEPLIDKQNKVDNEPLIDNEHNRIEHLIDKEHKVVERMGVDKGNLIYCLDSKEEDAPEETQTAKKVYLGHEETLITKEGSSYETNYSDTEDFRLHLDTEDFEDTNIDFFEIKRPETEINLNNLSMNENKIKDKVQESSSVTKTPKLNILAAKFPQLNLDKVTGVTPKLTPEEGDFIDLGDCGGTPHQDKNVTELFDRFIKHSKTKKKSPEAKKVLLGIVSKEVSEEGKEKLVHSNICVDVEEKNTNKNAEPPGYGLTKLKSALRAKLLEQRERERQRREKEKQFLESEKVIEDYHDDGLPDEEADFTDQSDTEYETESEPEEDDVIIKDKKRNKNKYLDEEAQEDEMDEEAEETETEENLDDDQTMSVEEDINRLTENDSSNDEENEKSASEMKVSARRKILNRIIDDDEDEEQEDRFAVTYQPYTDKEKDSFKLSLEDGEQEETLKKSSSLCTLSRASTEDLFSSQTQEETTQQNLRRGSFLPAHQPEGGFKHKREVNDNVTEDINSSALTPFSKFDFQAKYSAKKETVNEQSALSFLLTPLKASQFPASNTEKIKRSLCLDDSQETKKCDPAADEDFLDLCSGKFLEDKYASQGPERDQDVHQLLGLCSGQFESQDTIQISASQDTNEISASQDTNVCPGERKDSLHSELKPSDRALSAETVVITPHNSVHKNEYSDEASETSLEIFNENEKLEGSSKSVDGQQHEVLERDLDNKKMKRKRIVTLSDSEDDDNVDDDDGNESSDGSRSLSSIEYDENEEPITKKFQGFKDSSRGGIRADFLDKEAELSGSEDESEDEEEPNEDEDFMEQEAGDLEKFDEEELRNQVGKAHLKSLIDRDTREVRLLQELYFEDGDLHGGGRQRKFRWKNIDNINNEETRHDDDEVEKDEEMEEEENWRKERFEREKYLQGHLKDKVETQSEEDPESVFTLDRTHSLKFVQSVSVKKAPLKPSNSTHTQESPFLFNALKKRGSFLSRDKATLERLASFTKENEVIGGIKQSHNFVFHTLTEEEVEKRNKRETESRKCANNSVAEPFVKKMRIERSFFSMEESAQSKSIFKHL